jgi:NADPH-dependent ferric siderophore reductase
MTEVPAAAPQPEDPFRTMPGTTLMQLTVVETARVTPSMQRLTLTAPQLGAFEYRPGQDVMLLVATEGGRPVRRRYTIRSLNRDKRRLTLDIVRHSEGPGERWVDAARPGVTVEGVGPRGKISPDPSADWHLFIGDESTLAAIFAMVSSLPPEASATVILEVPEPADEQDLDAQAKAEVTWLHRLGTRTAGEPQALVEAARTVRIGGDRPHAYVFGEARVVLAVRETLENRGLAPAQISPKAYWGRGKANANHGEPPRDG